MHGLLRVICIDTTFRGRIVELGLTDSTCIFGANGVGKSVQLSLIPFFLGAEPSEIVEHSESKDPFTQFHFSTETSYLVFEYRRLDGELRCAVAMGTKDRKRVRYRFLEKGYDQADFVEDVSAPAIRIVQNKDFKAHLDKRGVEHSSEITNYLDYRAIIQNDKAVLQRSQERRSLEQIARRHSMVDGDICLRGIEKVVIATMDKTISDQTFRNLIGNLVSADTMTKPEEGLDKAKAVELENEAAIYREFANGESVFLSLDGLAAKVRQGVDELCELLHHIRMRTDVLVAQKANKEAELKELKAREATIDESFGTRIREAEGELEKIKLRLNTIEKEGNALQAQREVYESQDVDALKRDYASLPQLREELFDLQDALASLEKGAEGLRQEYGEREAEIYRKSSAEQDRLTDERDDIEARRALVDRKIADGKEEIGTRFKVMGQAAKEECDRLRLVLETKRISLDHEARHSARTQEEELELVGAQGRIDEIVQHIATARHGQKGVHEALLAAKREQNNCDAGLKEATSRLRTAEQAFEQFLSRVNPKPGTVMAFLHGNEDRLAWRNSIARVIHPDVLLRDDLNPVLTDDTRTVLGLSLEITKLDTPTWAERDDVLIRERERLEADCKRSDAAKLVADRAMAGANEAVSVASDKVDEYERRLESLERQQTAAKNSKAEIDNRVRAAVHARREEAKRTLTRVIAELSDLQRNETDGRRNLEKQCAEEQREYEADCEAERSPLSSALTAVQDRLRDLAKSRNAKLEELKRHYKQALSDKGLDAEVIRTMAAKIKALADRIRGLEERQHLIGEYERFCATEISLKEDWRVERMDLGEKRHQTAIGHAQLRSEYRDEKEAVAAAKGRLVDLVRRHDEDLTLLHNVLQRVENPAPARQYQGALREGGDEASALVAHAFALAKSLDEARKGLSSAVLAFETMILTKAGGHHLQTDWFALRGATDRDVDKVPLINDFRQKCLDTRRQMHLQQVRSIGARMKDYSDWLKDVERKIRHKSAGINEHIDESSTFKGISGLKVELVPTIAQEDFWSFLQKFNEQYSLWMAREDDSLPPAEMMEALRLAAERLAFRGNRADVGDMFHIKVTFMNNGRLRQLSNKMQGLSKASSTGLSYILQCLILVGVMKMIKQSDRVRVPWIIDEVAILDLENLKNLLRQFELSNIFVLAALPQASYKLFEAFASRRQLTDTGFIQIVREPRAIERLVPTRRKEVEA